MIAGLLQGENNSDTQGLPWVGNVPACGALSRSEAYKRQETDLVSPRPAAADPSGWCLATRFSEPRPTNRRPASDAEFFLGGQQEVQVQPPEIRWRPIHRLQP